MHGTNIKKHAACFGHTVHPEELNIMYFMPEDEDVFLYN